MRRRDCLSLLALAGAYSSCEVIKIGKTFTLSTDNIIKKATNFGSIDDGNLYSYPAENDTTSILLWMKGLDKKTIYNNLAEFDSLEFGESLKILKGKPIYGVKKGFK